MIAHPVLTGAARIAIPVGIGIETVLWMGTMTVLCEAIRRMAVDVYPRVCFGLGIGAQTRILRPLGHGDDRENKNTSASLLFVAILVERFLRSAVNGRKRTILYAQARTPAAPGSLEVPRLDLFEGPRKLSFFCEMQMERVIASPFLCLGRSAGLECHFW